MWIHNYDLPSDKFYVENPELVSELAHYVLVNNLASVDKRGPRYENQSCYRFKRLSNPQVLRENGFVSHSASSYQRKLLDIRRWMVQIGIFNNYETLRVYNVFYTPLGHLLRDAAVEDKEASLQSFRNAFDVYKQGEEQDSLTELRFGLLTEPTLCGLRILQDMVRILLEKTDLDREKLRHAVVLKLQYMCFGEVPCQDTIVFKNEIKVYRELIKIVNYFDLKSRYSNSADLIEKITVEIVNFLTGKPQYCSDFRAMEMTVSKLISELPDRQQKAG